MASRLTANRLLLVAAIVCGLGALIAGPFLAGEYRTMLIAHAFVYAVLAISLDLVWGYTGIADLGRTLWFGIGALGVGLSTSTLSGSGTVLAVDTSPLAYVIGIVGGTAAAVLFAGIVSWYAFTRHASHFYIVVVGLSLASAAQPLYTQFPTLTGGENGIFGFGLPGVSNFQWYYIAAGFLAVVTGWALIFVRSDFGLLMQAVRHNEERVRYLGFNVERVKIIAYTLSAGIAALAGGVFATMAGVVSAPMFGFIFATEVLVWVAVGGRGTVFGPIIGTIVLSIIGAELNAKFPAEWGLFQGLLFVIVVVFLPLGLLPPLRDFIRRLLGVRAAARQDGRHLIGDHIKEAGDESALVVASAQNVEFAYGRLKVLRGVTLDIHRSELLCIVGPNGAGKSTLIGVMTDGERPISGEVTYTLDHPLKHRGAPPHEIAAKGAVRKFQIPSLFRGLTVVEHLFLASVNGRWMSLWRRTKEVRVPQAVMDVCQATSLTERENSPAQALAHGLKQGLDVAMTVATRPRIIFMDEPTAGLTGAEREVMGTIFRQLAKSGVTVVLIEHDLDFVEQVADRIAVLHDGRVIECGAPADVIHSKVVKDAYLGSFELHEDAP